MPTFSAHEAETNPAGGPIDSNPYGLLAQAGARIVADAGANALLRVAANGDVSTLAVFPVGPPDAVPTSVVLGPDGAYYVGQLTGFPFAPGAARVFRILPCAPPEIFAAGFQTIIDLDFGPDGSLYCARATTTATRKLARPKRRVLLRGESALAEARLEAAIAMMNSHFDRYFAAEVYRLKAICRARAGAPH